VAAHQGLVETAITQTLVFTGTDFKPLVGHAAPLKQLIKDVEAYWRNTGMSSLCGRCIAEGIDGDTYKGCCTACDHLGPSGCTEKSLPCALWTCRHIDRYFPEQAAVLKRVSRNLAFVGIREASGFRWSVEETTLTPAHLEIIRDTSSFLQGAIS